MANTGLFPDFTGYSLYIGTEFVAVSKE